MVTLDNDQVPFQSNDWSMNMGSRGSVSCGAGCSGMFSCLIRYAELQVDSVGVNTGMDSVVLLLKTESPWLDVWEEEQNGVSLRNKTLLNPLSSYDHMYCLFIYKLLCIIWLNFIQWKIPVTVPHEPTFWISMLVPNYHHCHHAMIPSQQ